MNSASDPSADLRQREKERQRGFWLEAGFRLDGLVGLVSFKGFWGSPSGFRPGGVGRGSENLLGVEFRKLVRARLGVALLGTQLARRAVAGTYLSEPNSAHIRVPGFMLELVSG